MTTPTFKIYPSALLEKDDLEQRLDKKFNDVNSFNNLICNIKEMIDFISRQNQKRKYKNYKNLNTN